MIDLELEKKKLELKRVTLSKEEMEFKILERQADIERLYENIKVQDSRIEELSLEINK